MKNQNMSKKLPQKPKKCCFEYIHIQNCVTLDKYLNWFFWKYIKNDQFEVFLVGKLPKSSVFNEDSLDNRDHQLKKKSLKSKMGQIKKSCFRNL